MANNYKSMEDKWPFKWPLIIVHCDIPKRKPIEKIRANDPERDRRLVQRTALDGKGELLLADICCHDQAEYLDWLALQPDWYPGNQCGKGRLNWKTEIITDPEILKTARCYCGLCVEERTGKRQ